MSQIWIILSFEPLPNILIIPFFIFISFFVKFDSSDTLIPVENKISMVTISLTRSLYLTVDLSLICFKSYRYLRIVLISLISSVLGSNFGSLRDSLNFLNGFISKISSNSR
ncbi:hypothetical protein ACOTWC_06540 [Aliarcobacter butzleri]